MLDVFWWLQALFLKKKKSKLVQTQDGCIFNFLKTYLKVFWKAVILTSEKKKNLVWQIRFCLFSDQPWACRLLLAQKARRKSAGSCICLRKQVSFLHGLDRLHERNRPRTIVPDVNRRTRPQRPYFDHPRIEAHDDRRRRGRWQEQPAVGVAQRTCSKAERRGRGRAEFLLSCGLRFTAALAAERIDQGQHLVRLQVESKAIRPCDSGENDESHFITLSCSKSSVTVQIVKILGWGMTPILSLSKMSNPIFLKSDFATEFSIQITCDTHIHLWQLLNPFAKLLSKVKKSKSDYLNLKKKKTKSNICITFQSFLEWILEFQPIVELYEWTTCCASELLVSQVRLEHSRCNSVWETWNWSCTMSENLPVELIFGGLNVSILS